MIDCCESDDMIETCGTFKRLIYPTFHIRGSLNKFPDFFRMDTFIDSTHMKL